MRGRLDEAAAVLENAYAARATAPEGPSVARTVIGMLTVPPMKQLEAAERVARKFAETTLRGRCYLAEILDCAGQAGRSRRRTRSCRPSRRNARRRHHRHHARLPRPE